MFVRAKDRQFKLKGVREITMQRERSVKNRSISFLTMCMFMGAWVLGSCATSTTGKSPTDTALPASIQEIKVSSPENDRAVVEIISDKAAPYTTFRLADPPRVALDIRGVPGARLPKSRQVNNGIVTGISWDEGKSEPMTTRVVVRLTSPADYKVVDQGNTITLTLSSESKVSGTPAEGEKTAGQSLQTTAASSEGESGPRIFFKPTSSGLNEVLGVDFAVLDHGKSRLTVTTARKTPHHLGRTGARTLLLTLDDTDIPPLLQRRLDSSYFEGAVDRVKASYSPADKRVSLAISLREMVPFHMDQTDKGIIIDFERTDVKPLEKEIGATKLVEPRAPKIKMATLSGAPVATKAVHIPGMSRPKKYTGARMTMDFVNADVTNILRLIGEVSNLNIIWGPEVKGKVSMRLKNVPWDQALDLVLANNNLAKRREGNVIWVTTRAQMSQIEQEELKKEQDIQKRLMEQKKMEEELQAKEPVETQYITINYVDVENIKGIIEKTVKSPTGKVTVDKKSRTIIMTDGVSKIEEAKAVAKKLDKPTKQVMIEARIVEASTTFSRDLGLQWEGQVLHRNSTDVPFQPSQDASGYPNGGTLYNPSFATNRPVTPGNLGFVLTTLSGSGLTASFLNAQITLSESEGQLKVLSAPKVVTRDTVKATIMQGTKLVLPSGTDSNGNKTYQLVDAALRLEVTPNITPNDRVVMDVSVNDDFPDYANARGDNVPINTKSATTTMMVTSGDTVIIGGIFKENKGVNENGQPWLKDIPILGWLFKTKSWNDTRTELLIFLTPTVLPAT
jgi:type IV pilus assembly protein PilQ